MPDPPTVLETRVRFDETDLQGVAYFGEYFTYMDEAYTAYLRRLGTTYGDVVADGWTTHVVHAEMDYLAAAEFEDRLEHGFRITGFGRSSFRAEYRASVAATDEMVAGGETTTTGETVAEGEVVHVAVGTEDGDPIPVPDDFREQVAAFQDDPPETESE